MCSGIRYLRNRLVFCKIQKKTDCVRLVLFSCTTEVKLVHNIWIWYESPHIISNNVQKHQPRRSNLVQDPGSNRQPHCVILYIPIYKNPPKNIGEHGTQKLWNHDLYIINAYVNLIGLHLQLPVGGDEHTKRIVHDHPSIFTVALCFLHGNTFRL